MSADNPPEQSMVKATRGALYQERSSMVKIIVFAQILVVIFGSFFSIVMVCEMEVRWAQIAIEPMQSCVMQMALFA